MRHLPIAAAMIALLLPAPALAQSDVDRRIERLEDEVRALQRRVFPGGDAQFFEPEIPAGTPTTDPAGTPASAPITDALDRINSLERQLARLTGQVEENGYALRQLQAEVRAMRGAAVLPGEEAPTDGTEPPDLGFGPDTEEPAEEVPEQQDPSADTGPFSAEGAEPPLPSDPGEASYVRGYRLWRDGRYEEARAQLSETVQQFPGHRFESYARNLLGRAYLDDNQPANATEIFVRNYQELPNGERAADSLFYLGVALTQLDYEDRACLAFSELQEGYGNDLRSDIAEQLPAARNAAGCE